MILLLDIEDYTLVPKVPWTSLNKSINSATINIAVDLYPMVKVNYKTKKYVKICKSSD